MLERHDSRRALETEREEDEREEEQEGDDTFSPRAHQDGFWS
ncbi:hypothetical protein [Bosea sp. (in: a-proteobacteria)]|nr:hypothetical protein [Bosea sp. (in: a-proteobacteria)]